MNNINKEQFCDYYYEQNLSYAEIAKLTGIHVSKIKRIAKAMGVEGRSKSEAQKIALESNRATHPTEGKQRSEDVKLKIATSSVETWRNKPDEEKERLRQIHKENYAKIPESKKEEIQKKAHIALRKTLDTGSKLECYLVDRLRDEGHLVETHVEKILNNQKLHLDLLLPKIGLVIEVDGPSHFLPIWGVDRLASTMKADTMKNGLIIEAGLIILRIQHTKKKISKKNYYDILAGLLKIIASIDDIRSKQDKILYLKIK